jgi:hypothetical protein
VGVEAHGDDTEQEARARYAQAIDANLDQSVAFDVAQPRQFVWLLVEIKLVAFRTAMSKP